MISWDVLLELLIPCSETEAWDLTLKGRFIRVLHPVENNNHYFKITNMTKYLSLINKIYLCNNHIRSNFSKQTIYSHIESSLKYKKSNNQLFSKKDYEEFIKTIQLMKPTSIQIFAPIKGIYLPEKKTSPDWVFRNWIPRKIQLSPAI